MKTYHFTVTDSKGNQVATCEIAHDGIHAGARDRAKTKAKAWKAREGYKGTMTCRTVYGSNPEPMTIAEYRAAHPPRPMSNHESDASEIIQELDDIANAYLE